MYAANGSMICNLQGSGINSIINKTPVQIMNDPLNMIEPFELPSIGTGIDGCDAHIKSGFPCTRACECYTKACIKSTNMPGKLVCKD